MIFLILSSFIHHSKFIIHHYFYQLPEAPPPPELEKALVKEEVKLLLNPKGENEPADPEDPIPP